jgi:hypothetical protein
MKTTDLSCTLQTPNGHALRREIARAINYIETVSIAMKRPCDQAAELAAVFAEAHAYLVKQELIKKAAK